MTNYRLIYASSHNNLSFEAIDQILTVSRSNNARDYISGALIVSERYFLQVLEGNRAKVAMRFTSIMKDPRHNSIEVISARDNAQRLFSDWTMREIMTMSVKDRIMTPYLIDAQFIPIRLSEARIIELCQKLSLPDSLKRVA
ncbi:BLUF domain-containing protein [Yoonia sp.]|uniref:BLUF domain-containing protein n=1 Tax=Yoonia sp. TaxID=2212373 RepID=UPI002DF7FDF8|nr:BLUF domain-containing protein [Yoonia sp.]